jgi:hypothetical protein
VDSGSSPSDQQSVAPTAEQSGSFNQDRLNSALLTLEELPIGWTVRPPQTQNTEDEDFCGFEKQRAAQPVAKADASFQQSQTGPFLVHTLELYDGDDAKAVADQYLAQSRSCSGWTATDKEGKQTKWKLTGLSFPKLGDQTIALRLTSEATILGVVEDDIVVVRRGRVLNTINYATIGFAGIDSAQTEEFVRLADEKLQR